eukprot:471580-Pyramimonas_sp.AAC.1
MGEEARNRRNRLRRRSRNGRAQARTPTTCAGEIPPRTAPACGSRCTKCSARRTSRAPAAPAVSGGTGTSRERRAQCSWRSHHA